MLFRSWYGQGLSARPCTLRGMRLNKGRKAPSGSTGMSSAATFGSANDGPVHPARESFAPTATICMRKKNGELCCTLFVCGKNSMKKTGNCLVHSYSQPQGVCERKTGKEHCWHMVLTVYIQIVNSHVLTLLYRSYNHRLIIQAVPNFSGSFLIALQPSWAVFLPIA